MLERLSDLVVGEIVSELSAERVTETVCDLDLEAKTDIDEVDDTGKLSEKWVSDRESLPV